MARRAGVAKGTIYRYFTDKEALFMAAVRSRATPVFDEISGFVDSFQTRPLAAAASPLLGPLAAEGRESAGHHPVHEGLPDGGRRDSI